MQHNIINLESDTNFFSYRPLVSMELQPFRCLRRIALIAISVLPGTYLHLSEVKHARLQCLPEGHTYRTARVGTYLEIREKSGNLTFP